MVWVVAHKRRVFRRVVRRQLCWIRTRVEIDQVTLAAPDHLEWPVNLHESIGSDNHSGLVTRPAEIAPNGLHHVPHLQQRAEPQRAPDNSSADLHPNRRPIHALPAMDGSSVCNRRVACRRHARQPSLQHAASHAALHLQLDRAPSTFDAPLTHEDICSLRFCALCDCFDIRSCDAHCCRRCSVTARDAEERLPSQRRPAGLHELRLRNHQ